MARERFRRMLVGGFEPAQVRAAIDERDERLVRLEREAKALAQRVIDAERRIQAAQGAKGGGAVGGGEAAPASGDDATGPIESIARRVEDVHAQARRQATRIRMAALEDAVQITDRIGELMKLREELSGRVRELAGMAGIKLGAGEDGEATFGRAPAAANGAPPDGVYSGAVRVELGPLRDFAQLSLFQDAAAGIDAASEIKVTRVSQGRATVSMNLDSPVELLRELEERAPFEFKVRDTRGDGVVLDIDDADGDDRRAA
ncbi:MAG: hypothetical protein ACRDKH_09450 [Solirubrobacterales bacterium]